MPDPDRPDPAGIRPAPTSVAVIGAGMVGLCTAWFLQEHDVDVTLYDKDAVAGSANKERPAAGASWGNAGWLTPSLAAPLPEPAIVKYGVRAVLDRGSPVHLPIRADRQLVRFLASFLRHSTLSRWQRGMQAMVALNQWALDAFDVLADGGVQASTHVADPFLAAFTSAQRCDDLLREFEHMTGAGQAGIEATPLTGAQARELEPMFSSHISAAVQLYGQRYIHPPHYLAALAESVRERGASLVESATVTSLAARRHGVVVNSSVGDRSYDAVVVATGAELGGLVHPFGVRRTVQAGRGYSFSVPVDHAPGGPLYFPEQRVACTPLGDRLRVVGMMEFQRHGAPLDPRRIQSVVNSARPLLRGTDLDDRRDEWVGSRPVTGDGLPLIGPTRDPRIQVAGGHGMWGITLGPITGQLLAESLVKGQPAAGLQAFDPLR